MANTTLDNIGQRVEAIEQTLEQPVQTDKDRDCILQQAKTQIKELQDTLKDGRWSSQLQLSADKGIAVPQDVHRQTCHVSGQQETMKLQENAEEKWKICECGTTNCPICEAEREAVHSARSWMETYNDFAPLSHGATDIQERHEREDTNKQTHTTQLHGDKSKVFDIMHRNSSKYSGITQKELNDRTDVDEDCASTKTETSLYEQNTGIFDATATEFIALKPTGFKVEEEPRPAGNTSNQNEVGEKKFDKDCDCEGEIVNKDNADCIGAEGALCSEREEEVKLVAIGQKKEGIVPTMAGVLLTTDGMQTGQMRVIGRFQELILEQIDPREVSCLVDHTFLETGITSMCIIQLHPIMSTVSSTGEDSSNVCGVVALLFAEKLIKVPQTQLHLVINQKKNSLSYDTYQVICGSMSEGFDIYFSNYRQTKKQLNIADIVLATSHLGVHLQDEKEIQSLVAEAFVDSLMSLIYGQIILLLRWTDYKVISAIRGQENNDLVIFDCQPHTAADPGSDEDAKFGAFIYHVVKNDLSTVRRTVALVEKYSGKLEGVCVLAVIQT